MRAPSSSSHDLIGHRFGSPALTAASQADREEICDCGGRSSLTRNRRFEWFRARYRPARHLRVSHGFRATNYSRASSLLRNLCTNRSRASSLLRHPCTNRSRASSLLRRLCVHSGLRAVSSRTWCCPTSRCNCSISVLSDSYSAILRLRNFTVMVALLSMPRGVSR